MKTRVLGRAEAESLRLGWGKVLEALEQASAEKRQGLLDNPPKPAVDPRDRAFAHAVPAYLKGMNALGCKWIADYPANRGHGRAYLQSVFVLASPGTGEPLCIVGGGWPIEIPGIGA